MRRNIIAFLLTIGFFGAVFGALWVALQIQNHFIYFVGVLGLSAFIFFFSMIRSAVPEK